MAPAVSVKELYRRLVACTFEDGKVRDLQTALEILKTLESTKMTVNDLQETRFGRLVNNIRRKNSDATLCRQSKKLIRLWQRVASELNDSQMSNGGTPGPSQPRRGTTPGAAANPLLTPTSSSTKVRNPPPKMAPLAARSPAVSNGPTRGRPRKDASAAAAQTPTSKQVGHLRNGHDVTPSRSTSKSRVATPKMSTKRKVSTPNNSTAAPPGKRAKMTSQSSTSSNNRVDSPAKRDESRSSRKSEQKILSAKKNIVESEEFTTRVADNGLKIRIKKPPKTSTVVNNNTSGYQMRSNGQQQSNMHHHHHHPNSPHSPDSIDSDRTTVDTPPDVTSRLRPSSATSSIMMSSSSSSTTNHYTASSTHQEVVKRNACSGLAKAIFRPPISRESLPVHFDVTTDPFFCSTLQPAEGERCVTSSTDDGDDVEEIHGVNGCRGDNGKWYPWNEGILLKHRTQVVLNDEYDEGLLSILPYVEVE